MQGIESVRRFSYALLWLTMIAALVQIVTG